MHATTTGYEKNNMWLLAHEKLALKSTMGAWVTRKARENVLSTLPRAQVLRVAFLYLPTWASSLEHQNKPFEFYFLSVWNKLNFKRPSITNSLHLNKHSKPKQKLLQNALHTCAKAFIKKAVWICTTCTHAGHALNLGPLKNTLKQGWCFNSGI